MTEPWLDQALMDSAYIALSTKPHYISSVRVMQITSVYNDSLVKRGIVVNSVFMHLYVRL